jgi:uncharacterized Zn finger protein
MKHTLEVGDQVFLSGQDVVLTIVEVDPEDSSRDRVSEAVKVAWHIDNRSLHTVWVDPDALSLVAS